RRARTGGTGDRGARQRSAAGTRRRRAHPAPAEPHKVHSTPARPRGQAQAVRAGTRGRHAFRIPGGRRCSRRSYQTEREHRCRPVGARRTGGGSMNRRLLIIATTLATLILGSATAQEDNLLQRYDLAIENLEIAVASVPNDGV